METEIDVEELREVLNKVKKNAVMSFTSPFKEERVIITYDNCSIILTGRLAFGIRDCKIIQHERLDGEIISD